MTTDTNSPESADQLISHYRLPDSSVFVVGAFDQGITVLSQQVRSLNLAWALVESGRVPLDRDSARPRIAIVGAGFSGLTTAAGLLKKRVNADITIFERRDTVLPLQHGSDSRWLHPHIYDWPRQGSEAYSAALPVLNWTASRASDVVVQVLKSWKSIVADLLEPMPSDITWATPRVEVYCNTRHLQISENVAYGKLNIEWIGEKRSAIDPAVSADTSIAAVGDSQYFDCVVLAVGFGLETGAQQSYWRNETLAQPHLGRARETYIVSGSGDGAMIDTFRLRIAQYRQDRILAELFAGHKELLARLRAEHETAPDGVGFEQLQVVWQDGSLVDSTTEVLERLRKRLRQDTTVVLGVRKQSFTSLFDGKRVSFQNRLLAYLLYRCGAFILAVAPTDTERERLASELGIKKDHVVIRHGTPTADLSGLTEPLGAELRTKADLCKGDLKQYKQSDLPRWPGGYFDIAGLTEADQARASDVVKGTWRKEYLPSPTEAIASTFCSAIAGLVEDAIANPESRLRVTLHRTLLSGDEVVLQQCCDYQGHKVTSTGRAGRTFPHYNGTIGAAFGLASFVRSRLGATPEAIQQDMADMSLNEASQAMSGDVSSIAAIPLLGNEAGRPPGQPKNVIGILYLDSYDEDVFVDDQLVSKVLSMSRAFLRSLSRVTTTKAGLIANIEFWGRDAVRDVDPPQFDSSRWRALEVVNVEAPRTEDIAHLNFDYSDFTPVEQT